MYKYLLLLFSVNVGKLNVEEKGIELVRINDKVRISPFDAID